MHTHKHEAQILLLLLWMHAKNEDHSCERGGDSSSSRSSDGDRSDICLVLVERYAAGEGVERKVLLNGKVKKSLDLAQVCVRVKT